MVLLNGDACGTQCFISEGLGNLTVGLSPSGNEIVLTGTVTATNPFANAIEQVITNLSMCPGATVPRKDCPPIFAGSFSNKTLPSPIPIKFNQMAIVTVTFSFS